MDNNNIVIGECDGTGAAINVCLGFIPRYVKVINMEDAGSLMAEIEWMKPFELVAALDNGVMHEGGDDSDRQLISSAGISEYDGGDEIIYDGETSNAWEDSAGTSKEEVYVDGHYIRASSSDPAYKCIGDSLVGSSTPRHGQKVTTPPGFTIGTNADINQNGEQLCWIAIR